MRAETDLLPCPFCGEGEHLLVEHLEGTILHPAHRILCDNCGASTNYTDRDFRADWNTRTNVEANTEALRAEVAEARDGWHMANGTADLAMKHRDAAEARAERLAEAGRRVTAAFRAHGSNITPDGGRTRAECEAAMLALDAALEQETTNG